MPNDAVITGLGTDDKRSWPKPPEPGTKPIDLLQPNTDFTLRVKRYLVERLEASERQMTQFWPRWQENEKKMQAFIKFDDADELLRKENAKGKPAQAISIVVPFTFATVSTINTYLLHTFCGRKPMLQVGTYKGELAQQARNMELVLQYNADHTRLIKHMHQFLQDSQVYGLGILKTQWRRQYAKRTLRERAPLFNFLGMQMGSRAITQRLKKLVYQGNEVSCQDPYMFFPDPRVPLTEVNRRGEYVFWRSYEGKHILKSLEFDGVFKWVDYCQAKLPESLVAGDGANSSRGLRSGGDGTAGVRNNDPRLQKTYQVDQGSVVIIPAELGLGKSEVPEKWIFTILNKDTIVQAEPLDADHDMHPVACVEPYTQGYGFGNLGIVDYTGPIQDTLSWLVNSHIYNVRAALNNMLIVDPSMVEMQDMKSPEPGKLIRLKRAAYGQDVRTAVNQLVVQDITASHLKDMEAFFRMGQQVSGVNDNLMGLQEAGGRKTATEVRTAGEAGASRLAALARIISAQGLVDTTEQMVVNIQQYLDEDFYITILGEDGQKAPLRISPDQLSGDFHFPIHDGTLPLDRVALMDVWKEIMLAVAQDPELRSTFSLPKMFEWVAQLGGAQNINGMKVNMIAAPDAAVAASAQRGNVVPLPSVAGAGQGR